MRACGALVALIVLLLGAGAGGVVATQTGGPALRDGPGSGAAGPAMTRPVAGAVLSQLYGCTSFAAEPVDAACAGGHFHSGIDLAAALGTPVVAALDGSAHVVRAVLGLGLHVVIDHGSGVTTVYGHLSTVLVADGDPVVAGDRIGDLGSTGNSTGPHLHFEVRRGGVPEDPLMDVALP
ncbi:MAG TPA: M23 family metallopeptidase [Candidatus Dormibacteraeota bacterium]